MPVLKQGWRYLCRLETIIPTHTTCPQVPPTLPIHMDDDFFINEGIMGAMCGLVGDISQGVVCCLDPDWMEKLRRGERILERVPPNWQFICLPWLSNLNRDGGDAYVPVWRMLVVDWSIQAVQIYCSLPRGRGLVSLSVQLVGIRHLYVQLSPRCAAPLAAAHFHFYSQLSPRCAPLAAAHFHFYSRPLLGDMICCNTCLSCRHTFP